MNNSSELQGIISANMFALNLNDFAGGQHSFYTMSQADVSCTYCHHVMFMCGTFLIKASEGNELCNEYLMLSPSE